MNTNTKSPDGTFEAHFLTRLQDIISDAKLLGCVVGIDIVSKQPLAMGNVEMVPSVRPARHFEYMSDELLQSLISVNEHAKCLRVHVCNNGYLVVGDVEDKIDFLGIINEYQYFSFVKDCDHIVKDCVYVD